jgi:uncharacterized protein YbjT (DUF2867 family)
MGKLMVTGALGNVGGYVAKHAIANNQEVVVSDINVEALTKKYGDNAKSVDFDFLDSSCFADALDGVDRVFIMRPPHLGEPEDIRPFIQALKDKGDIQLVCFLSLIGIEKNPVPPHYKIEKYIEAAGLPYCHIRPSFFMQNVSGIHAFEIKHFDRIVVPVKKALTSFIDAEDIGEMTAKILSEPKAHLNRAYSITGSEAIDYFTVAKVLSEELGRKVTYTNPKPSFAKNYWIKVRGIDKMQATVMGLLYMMTRFGTANKVTTVFEDVMHKKPQTFRVFVRKNLDAWK